MEYVKFFHLLGLMMGGGAGFGAMVVAISHTKTGGGPPGDLVKTMKPMLGLIGLSGILLLWITGAIMTNTHNISELGAPFYVKLLAAALMLLIAIWLNYVGAKAKKASVPPPGYMDSLSKAISVLALIALALAIYVFN